MNEYCTGCGKEKHEGISEYCNNSEHRNCNSYLELCFCECHKYMNENFKNDLLAIGILVAYALVFIATFYLIATEVHNRLDGSSISDTDPQKTIQINFSEIGTSSPKWSDTDFHKKWCISQYNHREKMSLENLKTCDKLFSSLDYRISAFGDISGGYTIPESAKDFKPLNI